MGNTSYSIMIFLVGEAYIVKIIFKRMVFGHRFDNKCMNSNWINIGSYCLKYRTDISCHVVFLVIRDSLKFKNSIFILYALRVYTTDKYFHEKCQILSISVFCVDVSTISYNRCMAGLFFNS